MSLVSDYDDSLPYIDTAPTPAERAEIDRLITAEANNTNVNQPHPFPPPSSLAPFQPTELMQKELDRVAAGQPIHGNGTTGIDLARYEAPDAPEGGHDASVDDWRIALRRAYAASAYLAGRQENLKLLEEHGRNAWLVANAEGEEMLRRVEVELKGVKEAGDAVNRERKTRQLERQGELVGLEKAWKKGLQGTHEAGIAAENLRMEILARRRQSVRA